LLKFSTMETDVATVNFSVPDDVKAAFDKAFGEENKSAIVAELMRRAVGERQLQLKREKLFRQLGAARASRAAVTSEQIKRTRAAERP
jgi:hypothetical protein